MGIYGFDVVLVDGLIDASLVAARLRALAGPVQTQVVAYFHENQQTAPTAPGDRDVAKGIHWLHGARNWHTVLAADRVLFNGKTQLDAFLAAPPALFSGQCRDKATRGSHGKLLRAARNKASVLHYGLDLEELRSRDGAPSLAERSGAAAEGAPGEAAPVILWNARLEADKDPEEFLDVLGALAGGEDPRPFRVVVLGSDASQDRRYSCALREGLGDRLLFLGFCSDRAEYGRWLCRADILLVTAHHETFGISVVEAAFCGVFPVLPRRLSYPELLNPKDFPGCFYGKRKSALSVLRAALDAFVSWMSPVASRRGAAQSWNEVCDAIAREMHGGRKATKRMLHALIAGRVIRVLAMLCKQDIADDLMPLC